MLGFYKETQKDFIAPNHIPVILEWLLLYIHLYVPVNTGILAGSMICIQCSKREWLKNSQGFPVTEETYTELSSLWQRNIIC